MPLMPSAFPNLSRDQRTVLVSLPAPGSPGVSYLHVMEVTGLPRSRVLGLLVTLTHRRLAQKRAGGWERTEAGVRAADRPTAGGR